MFIYIFKTEEDFQIAFNNAIRRKKEFKQIISGKKSVIDDYFVHVNYPFYLVSLVDYKLENNKNYIRIQPGQLELSHSRWSKRFFYLICLNHFTSSFLKSQFEKKGTFLILRGDLAKKKYFRISPIYYKGELIRYHLFLSNKHFENPKLKYYIRNNDVIHKTLNDLIIKMVYIFKCFHEVNMNMLASNL